MRWDGHSGGVLLRFGGLFLRDLLKVGRERERALAKGMVAWPFVGHAIARRSHSRSYQRERDTHTQRDIECNKSVSSTQKLHDLLLIYSTWRAWSHVINTCTYLGR